MWQGRGDPKRALADPVHCCRRERWSPELQPVSCSPWTISADENTDAKDPDAGKAWRREEKGTPEDEMAGWHHRLHGHAFEQTPGVGDGQGGLACCSPWGHKESDTTATELDRCWRALKEADSRATLKRLHFHSSEDIPGSGTPNRRGPRGADSGEDTEAPGLLSSGSRKSPEKRATADASGDGTELWVSRNTWTLKHCWEATSLNVSWTAFKGPFK